jgi:hypothetical protein
MNTHKIKELESSAIPMDLYSDHVRGCSASMPLLSAYVPLAAIHLAGQAFDLQTMRSWPRLPNGKIDIPLDLNLRSCTSYFDLRAMIIRHQCRACGAEHVRQVTGKIRADWSLDPDNSFQFYEDMVEFHRVHDACQPLPNQDNHR